MINSIMTGLDELSSGKKSGIWVLEKSYCCVINRLKIKGELAKEKKKIYFINFVLLFLRAKVVVMMCWS